MVRSTSPQTASAVRLLAVAAFWTGSSCQAGDRGAGPSDGGRGDATDSPPAWYPSEPGCARRDTMTPIDCAVAFLVCAGAGRESCAPKLTVEVAQDFCRWDSWPTCWGDAGVPPDGSGVESQYCLYPGQVFECYSHMCIDGAEPFEVAAMGPIPSDVCDGVSQHTVTDCRTIIPDGGVPDGKEGPCDI